MSKVFRKAVRRRVNSIKHDNTINLPRGGVRL